MGVAASYQSRGVGYQLKLAQRELVLDQGIDLVTWTYDPLESRNAYLNIHKLGGVCRTYMRDYYGPLTDGLGCWTALRSFPGGVVDRGRAGAPAPGWRCGQATRGPYRPGECHCAYLRGILDARRDQS